jgi:hypothetical protein
MPKARMSRPAGYTEHAFSFCVVILRVYDAAAPQPPACSSARVQGPLYLKVNRRASSLLKMTRKLGPALDFFLATRYLVRSLSYSPIIDRLHLVG